MEQTFDINMGSSDSRMAAVECAIIKIRNKIILGEYPKKMSITEAKLAEDCALSRGSIRSALSRLETEGLITSKSNGRKEISGVSMAYVRDLYDMRERFEQLCIQTIMNRKTDSEYEYISGIVGPLSQLPSAEGQFMDLRAVADMNFHKTLIQISQNRILAACWNVIGPVVWNLQSVNAIYGRTVGNYELHVAAEHNEIIKLLMNRDERIYPLMESHVRNAEKATVMLLSEKGII
ncbi:GntR family transcriptional regulator [uncultured Flavonifractor sp.]|uniref:GntR family transcriptional regulator n=1 Tax=uncultured Flavonifractor sp. TaxID=1193534 RepID=UPI00262429D1|nr:GntR family transcriptional regulator [uncultured Flavonifractor sp.]